MAEYHVGAGVFGNIYAGTLKTVSSKKVWNTRNEVTDEAIEAVLQHCLVNIKEGEKSFGYEWDKKDGKGKVKLMVTVEDEE